MSPQVHEDNEANQFAMELLMPFEFVKREVDAIGAFDMANDKHLKRLADKFRVPLGIMSVRLSQLYNQNTT